MSLQSNSSLAIPATQEEFKQQLEKTSVALGDAYNDAAAVEPQLVALAHRYFVIDEWKAFETKLKLVYGELSEASYTLASSLETMNNEVLPVIVNEHFRDAYRKEKVQSFKDSVYMKTLESYLSKLPERLSELQNEAADSIPGLKNSEGPLNRIIDHANSEIKSLEEGRKKAEEAISKRNYRVSVLTEEIRDHKNEIDDLSKRHDENAKEEIKKLQKEVDQEEQESAKLSKEITLLKSGIHTANEQIGHWNGILKVYQPFEKATEAAVKGIDVVSNKDMPDAIRNISLQQILTGLIKDADSITKYIDDGYVNKPPIVEVYTTQNAVYGIIQSALEDFATSLGQY